MKKNFEIQHLTWLALAAVIYYFGLFAAYNGGLINLFSDAIIVNIGINIILAVRAKFNYLVFRDNFSLGHAGFMAIGAYSGQF